MTCDDWIKVADSLKWPTVVLILALLGFLFFRKQLANLLNRTTSIDRTGLKAELARGQQAEEIADAGRAQDLMKAFDSPLLLQKEKSIQDVLRKEGLDYQGDGCKVLIRALANAQIVGSFEAIYRVIFGGQIALLKIAGQSRGPGLSEDTVAKHFEAIRKASTPWLDDWSAKEYVGFLEASNCLIRVKGMYHITECGIEFLAWMVRSGLAENKGL